MGGRKARQAIGPVAYPSGRCIGRLYHASRDVPPSSSASGRSLTSALHGCRCPRCGKPDLLPRVESWSSGEVLREAIACRSCDATYDVIWGTPFLGHYESNDIIGLFEIAANAREDNTYPPREDVERLERLLREYDQADDKPAYLSVCSDDYTREPWFHNRYTEYSEFKTLSTAVKFVDRDVLDVGAGSGYDTYRLVGLGGRVTAVDYNPMLIRRGRSVVPEARWIGGFAHVLPFESETFDIVCCNAALHHMRDVPTALHEMLRVLRPGGWLLTTGDPFRPDLSEDDYEFEVFDNHPHALLGVNESIPTVEQLIGVLVAHEDRLKVELHVPTFHGARGRLTRLVARAHGKKGWLRAERGRLASAGGSMAMKVRVKRPLGLDLQTQPETALRAGDYAEVLTDYNAAVSSLVALLPSTFVDAPFPGERQTKFDLLNGWQKPRSGSASRTGYRRARWFLTRPADANMLRFFVRRPSERFDASLLVQVDGEHAVVVPLWAGRWRDVAVPLRGVSSGSPFVCELQVALADAADAQFDDYCIEVKERAFV